MPKKVILKDLEPGTMFVRKGGTYRYIVSNKREDHCGNVSVYCYNLDGESEGYDHCGSEEIVVLNGGRTPSSERPPRFWMCWVEKSGSPMVKHQRQAEANGEAERLAASTGRCVYVLEATHCVTTKPRITCVTELH